MNSKDKMIELLVNKLRKRINELDRDAARLSLVNEHIVSGMLRDAMKSLRLAIVNLET